MDLANRTIDDLKAEEAEIVNEIKRLEEITEAAQLKIRIMKKHRVIIKESIGIKSLNHKYHAKTVKKTALTANQVAVRTLTYDEQLREKYKYKYLAGI